jgi:hypothetical protein
MALNEVDKAKIRVAIKCYLKENKEATAKEIYYWIESLELKLRSRLTPSILAVELCYCSDIGKNFLNIAYYKRKYDNTNVYYLKE